MQGFHPIQSSVLLVLSSIARTLKGLYFVIIYCEMFVLVYFPMPCVVFAQFLYILFTANVHFSLSLLLSVVCLQRDQCGSRRDQGALSLESHLAVGVPYQALGIVFYFNFFNK